MIIFSLITIAVLTAVDQLIKMLVVTHLKPVGVKTLIPNLLELKYLENSGASFGLFQGNSLFFAVLTFFIMAVILFVFVRYKQHNFFTYFAGIAIVAGGFGNLIDRVMFEYVIDYIHVMFFPYVFNFADSLVVLGTISFVIYVIFYMNKQEKVLENEKLEQEKIEENEWRNNIIIG